jgi:hypothetical protein
MGAVTAESSSPFAAPRNACLPPSTHTGWHARMTERNPPAHRISTAPRGQRTAWRLRPVASSPARQRPVTATRAGRASATGTCARWCDGGVSPPAAAYGVRGPERVRGAARGEERGAVLGVRVRAVGEEVGTGRSSALHESWGDSAASATCTATRTRKGSGAPRGERRGGPCLVCAYGRSGRRWGQAGPQRCTRVGGTRQPPLRALPDPCTPVRPNHGTSEQIRLGVV